MTTTRLLEQKTLRCVSIAAILLPAAAGALKADVDLSRVPDSWTSEPLPPSSVEAARKGGMTCEGFFIRKDGSCRLVYNFRKATWPYDQETCSELFKGLIEGYPEARKSEGKSAPLKNELIRPNGLELLCQEAEFGDSNATFLYQLNPKGLEQVMVTYPPSEREAALSMAIGVFTPVASPPASKGTAAFDRAYAETKPVAELLFYLALAAVAIALIIHTRKQNRNKQPPPLP